MLMGHSLQAAQGNSCVHETNIWLEVSQPPTSDQDTHTHMHTHTHTP